MRLGQKLDGRRRADLLAKAEKMAVKMRQSFLEIDTSGDSRLDPAETLAMFQGSEDALEPVSVSACVLALAALPPAGASPSTPRCRRPATTNPIFPILRQPWLSDSHKCSGGSR